MTLNKFYKELGKLIKQGYGRCVVSVAKTSFTHPMEGDGCTILDVHSVDFETINIIADEGGFAENKDGSERLRKTIVLRGEV